ncbi:MAG TPA: hypothetical protein VF526_15455 [Solirubrobacteraceae bacterium]|jgi:hypothetical protein
MSESASKLSGVEIFATGSHRDKPYSDADLADIVENFDAFSAPHAPQVLLRVPGVRGHDEQDEYLKRTDIPADGWVTRLWAEGGRLFADMDHVPPEMAALIKAQRYATVSAEIYDEPPEGIPEGASGKMLRRVAFLGGDIPEVKGLGSVPDPEPYSEGARRKKSGKLVLVRRVRAGGGAWACFSEVRPAKFDENPVGGLMHRRGERVVVAGSGTRGVVLGNVRYGQRQVRVRHDDGSEAAYHYQDVMNERTHADRGRVVGHAEPTPRTPEPGDHVLRQPADRRAPPVRGRVTGNTGHTSRVESEHGHVWAGNTALRNAKSGERYDHAEGDDEDLIDLANNPTPPGENPIERGNRVWERGRKRPVRPPGERRERTDAEIDTMERFGRYAEDCYDEVPPERRHMADAARAARQAQAKAARAIAGDRRRAARPEPKRQRPPEGMAERRPQVGDRVHIDTPHMVRNRRGVVRQNFDGGDDLESAVETEETGYDFARHRDLKDDAGQGYGPQHDDLAEDDPETGVEDDRATPPPAPGWSHPSAKQRADLLKHLGDDGLDADLVEDDGLDADLVDEHAEDGQEPPLRRGELVTVGREGKATASGEDDWYESRYVGDDGETHAVVRSGRGAARRVPRGQVARRHAEDEDGAERHYRQARHAQLQTRNRRWMGDTTVTDEETAKHERDVDSSRDRARRAARKYAEGADDMDRDGMSSAPEGGEEEMRKGMLERLEALGVDPTLAEGASAAFLADMVRALEGKAQEPGVRGQGSDEQGQQPAQEQPGEQPAEAEARQGTGEDLPWAEPMEGGGSPPEREFAEQDDEVDVDEGQPDWEPQGRAEEIAQADDDDMRHAGAKNFMQGYGPHPHDIGDFSGNTTDDHDEAPRKAEDDPAADGDDWDDLGLDDEERDRDERERRERERRGEEGCHDGPECEDDFDEIDDYASDLARETPQSDEQFRRRWETRDGQPQARNKQTTSRPSEDDFDEGAAQGPPRRRPPADQPAHMTRDVQDQLGSEYEVRRRAAERRGDADDGSLDPKLWGYVEGDEPDEFQPGDPVRVNVATHAKGKAEHRDLYARSRTHRATVHDDQSGVPEGYIRVRHEQGDLFLAPHSATQPGHGHLDHAEGDDEDEDEGGGPEDEIAAAIRRGRNQGRVNHQNSPEGQRMARHLNQTEGNHNSGERRKGGAGVPFAEPGDERRRERDWMSWEPGDDFDEGDARLDTGGEPSATDVRTRGPGARPVGEVPRGREGPGTQAVRQAKEAGYRRPAGSERWAAAADRMHAAGKYYDPREDLADYLPAEGEDLSAYTMAEDGEDDEDGTEGYEEPPARPARRIRAGDRMRTDDGKRAGRAGGRDYFGDVQTTRDDNQGENVGPRNTYHPPGDLRHESDRARGMAERPRVSRHSEQADQEREMNMRASELTALIGREVRRHVAAAIRGESGRAVAELRKHSESVASAEKKRGVDAEIEQLSAAGRLAPAEREAVRDQLLRADARTPVRKFSEGGKTRTATEYDLQLRLLRRRPTLFTERLAASGSGEEADAEVGKIKAHYQAFSESFAKVPGATEEGLVAGYNAARKTRKGLTADEYLGK